MPKKLKLFIAFSISTILLGSLTLAIVILQSKSASATNSNLIIYNDSLNSQWSNWSWGAYINFDNSSPINSGTKSIDFTPSSWGGLYLHTETSVDTNNYSDFSFDFYGNPVSLEFKIMAYDENNNAVDNNISLKNYGDHTPNTWKKYTIPFSDLNAVNRKIRGIAIQEISGQSQPSIYLDNLEFSLTQEEFTSKPIPTPAIDDNKLNNSSYTAKGGVVFKNGLPTQLKGVNWFGFETGTYVAHGLWTRNWKEMISQIKNLGFNSVRVPFCPGTLKGMNVSSINYELNQDLANLNSLEVFDKFLNELNQEQIYILLDHHRPDCQSISPLWYTSSYSETDWIKDLTFVAERYKHLGNLLGIDIKNEPHGASSWGTNITTDWNTAAEKAGNAILAVNPKLLIFVQGIQENASCSTSSGHWMGGNLEPFKCFPISPNTIPAQKLILSPHVYGPDVYNQSYFSDSSFPNNMRSIWETHFGFLVDNGLNIVPGEWGGKYGNGDPKDKVWQDSFADYLTSKRICNSFYWSWNPNSGDTGGILQDDWITTREDKLALLMSYYSSCKSK